MSKVFKIGRSHDNDIVLNNSTVSAHHAILKIDNTGQSATLSDLNSTNGTFVDGQRVVQERPVTKNSILRFGQEETTLNQLLSKAVPQGGNHTRISSSTPIGALTIGRGKDCRIHFSQDDVSTHHAILYKNAGGQVVIEDQSSTNGTFVNGQRINSAVLHSGDTVTITRKYALDWQQYFSEKSPGNRRDGNKSLRWIAAAAVVLLLCGGGYFLLDKLLKKQPPIEDEKEVIWDTEQIYATYNSAVCVTYTEWGVKASIKIGGQEVDLVELLSRMSGDKSGSTTLKVAKSANGNLSVLPGGMGAFGTAFFITDDGKMATNLHNTRPWLFEGVGKEYVEFIENSLREWLMRQGVGDLSGLRVEPVLLGLGIVLDGMPFSLSNMIPCSEYKGHNDDKRDCAIIQTENRQLPSQVKKIIDYRNADTSPEALTVGKTVFTIGFPFGPQAALSYNSNQELKNQVHKGQITQDAGEYEFGHDAASTHGASGSPMFNDKGRLVGIAHAGMDNTQGFNYAIKAKHILDLMK